jgi:hypothetical protein
MIEEIFMSEKLRYVTDEQGQRVGVLLDLEEYSQITSQSSADPDLLVGLSEAELQALAESALAPSAQARLEDLLTRNVEAKFSPEEGAELDRLLEQVDQLNVLKTRAIAFQKKILSL